MPDVRIEKEFKMSSDQIDDEILYQEAAKEIQAAQHAYNAYLASLEDQNSNEGEQ